MTNSNRLLLLLMMLALAITIITASSSFSEPDLSYAQTLGNIKDLSTDATDAHDPQVLVSGSNIYAIWVDFVTGNDDIYFKRSTDGGASFGDTINLSNDTGDSTDPDIASSNDGGTYVVWRDDTAGIEQILFQRSGDNGASFETGLSEYLTLSNNAAKNIDAIEPQIASDKSNVYVIWSQGNFDQGLTDVFFKRSTDSGAAFDDIINLSNNPNSQSSLPNIAVLDNNVYTAWSDGPFNNGEVHYRNSAEGGASFGDTINLSNDTGDSIRPEIAVSDSNVFIVWQNQATKGDNVFFKRSIDRGASFGNSINLSNNQGNSTNPEFSVNNSSSVYTVWQNQASNNKTHDIFFKKSIDRGASFGNSINLSNNQGNSTNPDITSANDGSAYIVWTDNYKGRSKVFFRVLG